MPASSRRASLLDNCPAEYQNSSALTTQTRAYKGAVLLKVGASSNTQPLTCVSAQSQSMGGSPKGADVEVDGEEEGHGDGRRCQRQEQLKHIPEGSAEAH